MAVDPHRLSSEGGAPNATQLKLDQLIRATHTATNRMMTVEDASRAHLDRIHDDFRAQAESAKPEASGSA
jgi:low affinity Fe/Cu permease